VLPPSKTDFGGQKSLFRHPAESGKCPGVISIDSIASTAISINFTAISINVVVFHDEEGVVLPRG
jgi:hypothetical protein